MRKQIMIFYSESEAHKFISEHGGAISIQYDWDEVFDRMIKEYVVRF